MKFWIKGLAGESEMCDDCNRMLERGDEIWIPVAEGEMYFPGPHHNRHHILIHDRPPYHSVKCPRCLKKTLGI